MHPLRGATDCMAKIDVSTIISIHAPLAGCDAWLPQVPRLQTGISIHAPLAGCDGRRFNKCRKIAISIHAPLAGCDARAQQRYCCIQRFQSTHPLRGATLPALWSADTRAISIHAPLAGCDVAVQIVSVQDFAISIHAPLAGCDGSRRGLGEEVSHFNPRTPCGVRRITAIARHGKTLFQSTHPLRGATTNG